MFSTFGLLEPNNDLQIAYFGCVIALYFLSFFYDHPVVPGAASLYYYLVSIATCLFRPIIGNFYHKDYPLRYLKGKICTMTQIEVDDQWYVKKFNIKEKLVVIAIGKSHYNKII